MRRLNSKILIMLIVFVALTALSAYERALNAGSVDVQEWGLALLIFTTADVLTALKLIFSD